MDIQNIIIECIDKMPIQNTPINTFSELENIDLIAALLKLIINRDVKCSSDAISYEIHSLFDEHFSSRNLIDMKLVVSGDCVELSILYLLLIYIGLLTNDNLRTNFFSSQMTVSNDKKLTYLLSCVQEKTAVCHEELVNLVEKNLDFVTGFGENNFVYSPQIRANSTTVAFQSPLRNYVQSPSFISERKLDQKNKEITILRQQIYNLEGDKQDLQNENSVLSKKKEKIEKERKKISDELKSLMKEYEESTNSALKDEEDDKKNLLNCQHKIKQLETDNKTYSKECSKISEENVELQKMLESKQIQLNKMTIERDKMAEWAESQHKACLNVESLLEQQPSEIRDMKNQLEELKHYFLEQKNMSRTINESFDYTFSQKMIPDWTITDVEEESITAGFTESEHRLNEVQNELSDQNKIIKELTNECQQLNNQLAIIEKAFSEKNTKCDSLQVKNEELASQLDTLKEMKTIDDKNILPAMYNSVTTETKLKILKNSSLLAKIDTLQTDNDQLRMKQCQLEEYKETMFKKVEMIENRNLEHSKKYEKAMEQNSSLLQKIICLKDEKENIQNLLNTFREGEASSTNKYTTLEENLNSVTRYNDGLQEKLLGMRENLRKKDDLLKFEEKNMSALKELNANLVREIEELRGKLSSDRDGSISGKKELLSEKEAAFVVERDLQNTIDCLQDRIQSLNEKISSDEKLKENMKNSFKDKMENVMEELRKLGDIEKDNEILRKKYEASKEKILEIQFHNTAMERRLSGRSNKLDQDRQHLQLKLVKVEAELKRANIENNSLTVKLQLAETSLRNNMKKNKTLPTITSSASTSNLNLCHRSYVSGLDSNKQITATHDNTQRRVKEDNNKMEAPLPPSSKKSVLRSSMITRGLKKTSSEAVFTTDQQTSIALNRANSVVCRPARMSNCNFNVRNAIPHSIPALNLDVDDADFVDGKLIAMADDSLDWERMSELQRRNSLYPPHMRSDYTSEMHYKPVPYSEDKFRASEVDRLSIMNNKRPGYNLRKRSIEPATPTTPIDKKVRRLTESSSRSQLPKSKTWSIPVDSDSKDESNSGPASPKVLRETRHGLSPANKVRRTPSSLSRIFKSSRSPWKRLHDKKEEPTSSESARKKMFRNPFGSKNYNVQSASLKNEKPAL